MMKKIIVVYNPETSRVFPVIDTTGLKVTEKNYITEKEWERLNFLRHIANINKTEEQWNEYCEFAKKIGFPKPNRNSKIRPLHEKYDKNGELLNPDRIIK